jgi:hypothetical protein
VGKMYGACHIRKTVCGNFQLHDWIQTLYYSEG